MLKAEKKIRRKNKGPKKPGEEDDNELQEDFLIDVKDARFKALHEDHQYAIDPSNPQFKKTRNMAALLEERSRRQRELCASDFDTVPQRKLEGGGEKSLTTLVESVKRKSMDISSRTTVKRRKL